HLPLTSIFHALELPSKPSRSLLTALFQSFSGRPPLLQVLPKTIAINRERTAEANNGISLVGLAGQEELLGESNEMEFTSNASLEMNDPAPTFTALSVPGDESEKPSASHDDSQKVDDARAILVSR
ncbi:unnamed protein product, partial [Scytosiphon promiscuus]